MRDLQTGIVLAGPPAPAMAAYSPPSYNLPPMQEPSTGLRELLSIVRRHLWLILAFVVVTLGLVVAYSLWMTPVYEVTSVLRVSEKRSPLPDVYENLALQEDAVSTEMEMLQSRTLTEDVIRDYALQLDLTAPRRVARGDLLKNITVAEDAPAGDYRLTRGANGQFLIEDRATDRHLGSVTMGAPVRVPGVSFVLQPAADTVPRIDISVSGLQTAVVAFTKLLKVDRPVRDADVVSVAYRGTDPALMVAVLNDLSARFIDSRQDAQTGEARSAVRFLRRQLDTLSRQLTMSEDSLRNYREKQQVIEPGEEANSQIDRFVSAQADRNTLDAERASLSQLVQAADSIPAGDTANASRYRNLIASPSLLKNQAAEGLLQSLMTVEDQQSDLLTRRTRRDPEVQALTARIEAIDNEIHSLAVTYLAGLNKQIGSLDQTLGTYSGQLNNIPQKELGYTRLERGTKVLEDAFTLLQTRLKDAEIAQAVEDPSVRIVDAAVIPSRPLRPNLPINLAVGLLLGLILGVTAALIKNAMDRSVRTRADVRSATGLPVIGLIPSAEAVRRMTRKTPLRNRLTDRLTGRFLRAGVQGVPATAAVGPVVAAGGIVTDAYARLEANIAQLVHENPGRMFLITSPMAGEGKTTSAVNLALTLARRGRRVLLIDADLRNSRLDMMLGERPTWGMSDILSGNIGVDVTVRQLQRDDVSIDYISSGTQRCRDSAAVLGSPRFRDLLNAFRPQYDVVIVDTPPLIVPDAVILSHITDGVILVVRAGATARAALGYAVQQLRVVGAPIIGAVLNDIDFLRDETYDEAFGYYGAAYAYAAFDGAPSTS
ncbi:MAG TPA: polysaccharide biosynthesis tyrosine autokinase [Gemmatimonadaceae bacterium]|nr:polysaccharide biosynthesis tyrosine autokinase [Gemmatimonadaceae bacterium]